MDNPSPSPPPQLSAAGDLQASIPDLLAQLVRIPSRAGVDSCDKIVAFVADWLRRHDVPCRALIGRDGRPVGITGQIGVAAERGVYVLNATADTVGFGDLRAWTTAPTSAQIADGWLYGRGSADTKAGIAIFCHLRAAFRSRDFAPPLGFVFDGDEHTGHFSGIRSYLERLDGRIAGMLIGYPGHDRIGVGARGFWRARLQVAGASAHSGSSQDRGTNAIAKASRLAAWLAEVQEALSQDTTEDFPLPPKLTVTGICGGGDFSLVPDSCEVDLDVRLTPAFGAEAAETHVRALLERLDAQRPCPSHSRIVTKESVPAYRLPADSALADTLRRAGERILGRPLPFVVTGPSHVGNLLAQRGIAATCGFGVAYRNVHAPDECVELSSIVPTFRVYEGALQELLGTNESAGQKRARGAREGHHG